MKLCFAVFLAGLSLLLPCRAEEEPAAVLNGKLIPECWTPGLGVPRGYFVQKELQPWIAERVRQAEARLGKVFTVPPADLYREFSRNGNRVNYENVYFELVRDLYALAYGYYVTGEERYLTKLDQAVNTFCDYPTWILPAHDTKDLANYEGRQVDIDLFSAENGHAVAAIYRLFGDRLPAKTRTRLRDEIRRRVLEPFADMVEGRRPRNFWMDGVNNWNPVCLSGVAGCILAVEEDRDRRAALLAGVVKYSRNYFKSFTPDGYCSEGLGYYNFGFGSYLNLAAMLRIATGGALDMLSLPESKLPSTFPDRIVIAGNLYPSFADTPWNTTLQKRVVDLRELLLRRKSSAAPAGGQFPVELLVFHFGNGVEPEAARAPELPPESIFPQGGVAVLRPGKAYPECRLSAVLKGGHNSEEHNHNDLGTYVIAVDGKVPVVLDAGQTVYTAQTFGRDRYKNPLLGSYGHSVPFPAGIEQSAGRGSRARLIGENATAEAFRWRFDLRSAYPGAGSLRKLERQFDYRRDGAGSFEVADTVEFNRPELFETAVITFGSFREIGPGEFAIEYEGKILRAAVDCGGEPFEVSVKTLKEKPRPAKSVNRIAIRLKNKVTKAVVTVRYTAE